MKADDYVRAAVEQLSDLVEAHDVVFLLTDTRERCVVVVGGGGGC